jgi:hypothetical protein
VAATGCDQPGRPGRGAGRRPRLALVRVPARLPAGQHLAVRLAGTELTGTELTRTRLTRAELTRTELTRAELTRTKLTWAELT